MTEVFGGPSSGKTSVAFALLAACTSAGLLGAYVDPSGAFYAPAAAGAGIALARLLVVRPPNPDLARRAVDALVRCGACALVVFDCAGLGDVLRAHQCARLASQAEKTGTALLALSAGNVPALASFASLRLRLGRLTPLWQEGSAGGRRLAGCAASIEVVKSRMSTPGKGISMHALLPDVAGSWPCDVEAAAVERKARPLHDAGSWPCGVEAAAVERKARPLHDAGSWPCDVEAAAVERKARPLHDGDRLAANA